MPKIHSSGGLSKPRALIPHDLCAGFVHRASTCERRVIQHRPKDRPNEDEMGELIQLRDYQNPKDLERLYSAESSEAQPARVQPFGVDFSAAEPYHAPPEDCA
jgi:hypothetical protein